MDSSRGEYVEPLGGLVVPPPKDVPRDRRTSATYVDGGLTAAAGAEMALASEKGSLPVLATASGAGFAES